MKNEPLLQIASHLCHIPGGTFMVKQHPADTKRSSLFMDSFQTRTSGKGRMDIYQVFPGIHLSLNLFLADQVSFSPQRRPAYPGNHSLSPGAHRLEFP